MSTRKPRTPPIPGTGAEPGAAPAPGAQAAPAAGRPDPDQTELARAKANLVVLAARADVARKQVRDVERRIQEKTRKRIVDSVVAAVERLDPAAGYDLPGVAALLADIGQKRIPLASLKAFVAGGPPAAGATEPAVPEQAP